MTKIENFLALDIGSKKIGLAVANNVAKIANPLMIIQNDDEVFNKIQAVVNREQINSLVVGLPRNLDGEETAQSAYTRKFSEKLQNKINIKITFADETLSTKRAEATIYKDNPNIYPDAVAACFILEEYLEANNDR